MMKKLTILLLAITFTCCKSDPKNISTEHKKPVKEISATKINVEIIDYNGLEAILTKNDDKTYIVNFWATWCKPCVEELPAFEKLYEAYKDKNVVLVLVSLDFPNKLESRVLPFIEKNQLKGKVVLMGDPNQNTWIPKVSPEWSGAIPATVIYNKNNRKFYEQSFDYTTLETELTKFLKTN
jgi:thiol-disulfide isomerase/thioredoxin